MSENRCPFCWSGDIGIEAANGNTHCRCMNCHALGPPAWHDEIKGSTAIETRRLRDAEADRLWRTRRPA